MFISFSQAAQSRCRQALYGLMWLLFLTPFSSYAGDLSVLLVLSGSEAPYQSFARTFRQDLPANIHVSVLEHAEVFSKDDQNNDLIVTIGANAGDWVVTRTSKPVLATMIPSQMYAELLAKRPRLRQLSAIFIDQPWKRQVSFLRAALPERKKFGVLYSREMHFDKAELRRLLAKHGAALIDKSSDSDNTLFDDLESILPGSDVLLALPDDAIYNSNNIRNILLDSYRHKVPLVGLSQSYVNAGAVCAIFSTVEQLAEQARAAVISFANTRQFPEPQYPTTFTIAVNQQVARSLEIALPSPEAIRRQMDNAKEREN